MRSTKQDETAGWSGSVTRLFFRLGIRGNFLFGFGIMGLVMAVSMVTAIFGTAQMSASIKKILSVQLPTTVEIIRVARATDSLVAASIPLASVTENAELVAAFKRVDDAQDLLHSALINLNHVAIDTDEIRTLTTKLVTNLQRLRAVTRERLSMVSSLNLLKQRLTENQQALLQHLAYRVRILDSDADILRKLLSQPNRSPERITEIVAATAPLLPVARFYAEVESIHTRSRAAIQQSTLTGIELAREVLIVEFQHARRTMLKMPGPIVIATTSAFKDLEELALSAQGVVNLRHQELLLVDEIRELMRDNQQVSTAVDAASVSLMNQGVSAINLSADKAENIREGIWLIVIAGLGVFLLSSLVLLHVDRHFIRRLSNLSDAMQHIATGRYDISPPPVGDDELGRLGAAVSRFHETARVAASREEELVASNMEAKKAKAALEQKAKELEEANKRLSALSTIDGLTGLANRRKFDEVWTEEWARARRGQHPIALIMLDIDLFKQFNDRYGHQSGDDCLRRFGGVLHDAIKRAGDVAARYGGEEFAIILPKTDAVEACKIAEKVRQAIQGMGIEHVMSEVGCLTASLGVASLVPDETLTNSDLLRAADMALYQAKANGRNCVFQLNSTENIQFFK